MTADPDVARNKSPVLPLIVLVILTTVVAWAAYKAWPTLQEALSVPAVTTPEQAPQPATTPPTP